MQESADADKSKSVGVDEQSIKFRPSPNFKNMKKFLKSKIDTNKETNVSSSPKDMEQQAPPVEKSNDIAKPAVYPPLPLDPPPKDSPPDLNIKLKEEVEDTEYEISLKEEENIENTASEELISEFGNDSSEAIPDKLVKQTICRDFVRGACSWSNCKFAHTNNLDPSQLRGVYTFCWEYQNQNGVCSRPVCRYVHASVFEEQQFYRTGKLPPHAMAHHKKELPLSSDQNQGETSNYINLQPLPPQQVSNEKPGTINCVPLANIEARIDHDVQLDNLQSEELSNREWADTEELGTPQCDPDKGIKCENCKLMEYRLHYNKTQVEELQQNIEDVHRKIAEVEKLNQKICSVLLSVVKRKRYLETVNSLISPKSRMALSTVKIDNNKNILNDRDARDIATLMAKLLQRNDDQNSPPDV